MHTNKNSVPTSIHRLLLVLMIIVAPLSGVLTFFSLSSLLRADQGSSKQQKVVTNTSINASKSCRDNDGIDICVGLDKLTYTTSENISITTTIKNNSTTVKDYQFSCDDTTPAIIVNSQKQTDPTLCAQVITAVKINPGKQVAYKQTIAANSSRLGENSITTNWQGMKSGVAVATVVAAPQAEVKSAETACLAGEDSNYCKSIQVMVRADYAKENIKECGDMDRLFVSLDVSYDKRLDNLCDLGVVMYFVPKSKANSYIAEFEKFDFVESAG